jgi:hypothetical protein
MSTFLAIFVTDALRSLHPNNQIQNFLPLSITEKRILEQRHKISQQSQTQNMPKKWRKKARSLSWVAASSDGAQRRARTSTASARAPPQVWMKTTIVGMTLWNETG